MFLSKNMRDKPYDPRTLYFLYSILYLLLLIGCAPAPIMRVRKIMEEPKVRVALLHEVDSFDINCNNDYIVSYSISGNEKKFLTRKRMKVKLNSKDNKAGLTFFDSLGNSIGEFPLPLRIESVSDTAFLILNNRKYRGILEIIMESREKLLIVNEINIENYLKGVVPSEIGKIDEKYIEVAKAQAIAARTYALNKLQNKTLMYDLEGNILDQVYLGVERETPLTDIAVEETQGIVITYKEKPIKAYYSACCGGHTAGVEEAWNSLSLLDSISKEYLVGRRDPYCKNGKWRKWERKYRRDELQMIVETGLWQFTNKKKWREYTGRITNMKVEKRGKSGRVEEIIVETSLGNYRLKKDKIRWVLADIYSNKILPSTWFTIKFESESVIFSGYGNGHGVGMCQEGAFGMANERKNHKDILSFYYKGVKLEKMW